MISKDGNEDKDFGSRGNNISTKLSKGLLSRFCALKSAISGINHGSIKPIISR
jgi:hypothetical protein